MQDCNPNLTARGYATMNSCIAHELDIARGPLRALALSQQVNRRGRSKVTIVSRLRQQCSVGLQHGQEITAPVLGSSCSRGSVAPTRRVTAKLFPFDQAWGPNVDAQSLAPQLFAFSLFPYLAFLYFLTKSGKAPKVTVFGFYFLLAFVGATIPAGIYAKTHYGTSLANVDWLHGSAESLLTITNLLIVLGLRQGIREAEMQNDAAAAAAAQPLQQQQHQAQGGDDAQQGNGVPSVQLLEARQGNGTGQGNGVPAKEGEQQEEAQSEALRK